MTQHSTFLIVLTLATAAILWPGTLHAQTLPSAPQPNPGDIGDWSQLSRLDATSQIAVYRGRRWPILCQNVSMNEQGLSCTMGSMWFSGRSFDFSRAEIVEVKLRHERRDFWIGVGAASAAGFAVGAWQPGDRYPQTRIGLGLAGAALSGLVSAPLVYSVVHWFPGKTIYRRPVRAYPLQPESR